MTTKRTGGRLLPAVSPDLLQLRLHALLQALGLRRLGLARRLKAPDGPSTDPCFEILAAVGRPRLAPGSIERALPPSGYHRLFCRGGGFRVDSLEQDALGSWLRHREGGVLAGWALPGDRLPWVALVGWGRAGWDPGPVRWKVARSGMEALARSLCPPDWWLPPTPVPKPVSAHPVSADWVLPEAHDGARNATARARPYRESPGMESLEILPPEGVSLGEVRDRLEATLIRQALRQSRGNMSDAARHLRMSRQSLYRKIRRLGLLPDLEGTRQGMKPSL